MTSQPKMTPCETGNNCQVPRLREKLQRQLAAGELKEQEYDVRLESLESSCGHETHPDDWFEDPGVGYGRPEYWRSQRAKAKCFGCPVRFECLQMGMSFEHGVWGGYTADQREQIKTETARISAKRGEPTHAETKSPQG